MRTTAGLLPLGTVAFAKRRRQRRHGVSAVGGSLEARIVIALCLVSWFNLKQLPKGRAEVLDAIVLVAAIDAHRRATLLELSFRF
jgi:hypothetical protein